MSSNSVEFDGEELAVGRHVYVVPSVPMRHAKRLFGLARQMALAAAAAGDEEATLEAMAALADPVVDILHVSIARNHPDVSHDAIERAMDVPLFQRALPVLLRVNALAKPGGDAADAGNGAASPTRRTGTPSTPVSRPRTAGRGPTSTGTSRSAKSSR